MNPTDLANQAQALADRAGALAAQARLMAETQVLPAIQHGAAAADPFLFLLTIFLLACFVGYYVVWNVTPALHSPLMGVTNAISSVIVVGAILAAGTARQSGRADLRLPRRDLRLGEHLRRLPGDAPDAGDVPDQEEGLTPWRRSRRSPTWSRRSFHPGAARAVPPDDLAAGQPVRHDRHGDRHRGDAVPARHGPGGIVLILAGIAIGGGVGAVVAKRIQMTALPQLVAAFHSLVGMAAVFVAAAAFYSAGELRHRHAWRYPRRLAGRDVARPGDRRHHLLRLGHRLRQAARPDVRRADHLPDAAQAELRRSACCCWCW